jgi:exopolysaccharide biosynthesis protein
MNRLVTLFLLLIASSAYAADWRAVAPGVDYQEFVEGSIDVHVARIDLTNDEIEVISTRENEKGLKVSDYAQKNNAIVAINGDYFDDKFNPIGLTIGPCGQWINTRDTAREGVIAVGDRTADIRRQAEIMDPPAQWIETAISGWPLLVRECRPVDPLPGSTAFTRAAHPRTAVGLSKDRKTLYFVVADGRRTGVPGMTLPELATFMNERLNACWAMNLDGGGSAAMWMNDRIVNRPSDGVERKVADHLAVIHKSDFCGCDGPMTSAQSTSQR